MNPRPAVALLGAAPGALQALARELIERLAQAGVGGEFAPEFIFELPTGKHPALTLLLALDAEPDDPGLREQLTGQRIPYSVLYGDAATRLDSAWHLLRHLLALPATPPEAAVRRAWNWACDKCSDPACEHRLFQDLVASRPAAPGTDRAP